LEGEVVANFLEREIIEEWHFPQFLGEEAANFWKGRENGGQFFWKGRIAAK
jgi:hypothetical protein